MRRSYFTRFYPGGNIQSFNVVPDRLEIWLSVFVNEVIWSE